MVKLIFQYNAAETSRVASGHIFSQSNKTYVQQKNTLSILKSLIIYNYYFSDNK